MFSPDLPPIRDPSLLTQALTHRSYDHEHPSVLGHNERLEFLGDAILNFLSGEFLYQRFPHKTEGELTRLRSALVDEPQLASFATQLDLGAQLRLGHGALKQGGQNNPNLMSCAFEAVVGAYFLSQDSDIETVRAWVFPFFEHAVEQLQQAAQELNPKSRLQAKILAAHHVLPLYRIVAESGPDHDKCFCAEVWLDDQRLGQGQGKRKQEAEKAAAKDALAHQADWSIPETE